MSQENAEKPPQKQMRRQGWIMLGCVCLLFVLCVVMSLKGSGPQYSVKLEGTIIVLNEDGDVLPYQIPLCTFYSHYAQDFFRSEVSRKRNLHVFETGFGNKRPIHIPKFPATLFFYTPNGKYAAVVDLAKGEPTTGLMVTLRPRYSATGRLVDQSGTPLTHHEFCLYFERAPEPTHYCLTRTTIFPSGETFESVHGESDSEGYFTVDRLIPGVEYELRVHHPRYIVGYATVRMPILQPEQYSEPFSLGDVSINAFDAFPWLSPEDKIHPSK